MSSSCTQCSMSLWFVRANDAAIAWWTRERVAALGDSGLADATAVFVAGMPRSGTTLVCHALYEAMHEIVHYLVDECCLHPLDSGAPESAALGATHTPFAARRRHWSRRGAKRRGPTPPTRRARRAMLPLQLSRRRYGGGRTVGGVTGVAGGGAAGVGWWRRSRWWRCGA